MQVDRQKNNVVPCAKITAEVYTDFTQIQHLRREWDTFVESVGGDIYFTYDWCRLWWEHYGQNRHLRIWLFHQDNKLVGVIPIFYERLWLGPVWLKMAKMVGSDFTLSMVNPPVQADYAEEIFRCVFDSLIQKEGCDAVWLGPISGKYDSLQHLRDAIRGHSEVMLFQDRVWSPYTTFLLPKTFDEYIQSLNKRQRGNLRRDLKLIDKSFNLTDDVVQDEKAAPSEFDKFVRMHNQQWKAEGKLGHFKDWPHGEQFNAKMALEQAKLGRLKLVRMRTDSQVVSYQLCYAFCGRWYWRLPARLVGPDWDKYALGRIGLIKEIEMAISEGVREIEAGAGHYDYKVKLGGEELPLYAIMSVKNNLFAKGRALLFSKLSMLLHYGYYRVWFNRLAPKLPFKRKPLWKLWIRTRL